VTASLPTLLFGVVGWNIAETTRMIEIAKQCTSWAAPVFMSYGGDHDQLVVEAGFPLHSLSPRDTPEKIEHLWAVDRGEKFAEPYSTDEIRERVAAECDLIAALKPAAMVMGSVLTFAISARAAAIPLVNVVPFALTRPYLEAGLPAVPGWPRFINRVISALALSVPMYTRSFNRVAAEHGLARFRTTLDVWSGDLNLVAEHPLLKPAVTLPPEWHFVGPIFADLPGDVPDEVIRFIAESDVKTVYFAMGSSAARVVLLTTMAALADLPIRVVAPIRAHLRDSDTVPANVMVTDWLPALSVNRLVDAALIHGGAGTVQTACQAGIPFVGIGMQPEQSINIEAVVRHGSARRLSRRSLSAKRLRRVLAEVLESDEMAARARLLASDSPSGSGAVAAASRIREFVSSAPGHPS
jgi:UDP:flavonoid glycosyltransferase YjiC (YdhE family)